MTSIRIPAAGGALLVNGLVLAALATLAGPAVVDQVVRPIEVAILPPPPPAPTPAPPALKPEPPKPEPPKPEPVRKTPPPPPEVISKPPPPRPTPAPAPVAAPQPAPAPAPEAPPVVAGKAVDAPRPAGITAEAAPSAPPAPTVTAPPAPPQKEGVREDASWAGNVLPTYPAIAKRLGEQGTVKLLLKIGPEGTVLEAKMVQSSGSPALDARAVETYRKWRFKPATVDGRPVTDWYPINFRFTLDE